MALTTKSLISRNKLVKIRTAVARMALLIASRENPGLYSRYEQQRKKFITLKMMIIKKYTPKAVVAVRNLLRATPKK